MALVFKTNFQIRFYELDSHGELRNSMLARLFQETAMRATTDAGFASDWFTARKSVWVVHELTLEHLRAIHNPDEIEITTWLSDLQRIRTHREYLARNAATQEIVARGRGHWAHLSVDTLAPARIPDEIRERFAPNGERAILRLEPRAYPAVANAKQFRARRRVQRYETDAMQHVNNTIYFDWIEETLADATEDWAGMNARAGNPFRLCIYRHDIAYVRAALPGDQVEIIAHEMGAGHCASAWSVEIKRGAESFVRDHVTALWVDDVGRSARSLMRAT